MISKLEIYAIVLVILLLGFVGAYFKGRLDEKATITRKTDADNTAAMQRWINTAEQRSQADDLARQRTQTLIETVDQGLTHVHDKFAKLPTVVVDARGCERLTPAARLRWNAVELLSAGPNNSPTGGAAPGPLPADGVPATQ